MLAYVCKYAPIEAFAALGVEMQALEPQVANFNRADELMHPNVCSFAKGVLEAVVEGGFEGIVLTTCCDSVRRLYDTLREQMPGRFVYLLDVPRIVTDAAAALFAARIRAMLEAYSQFSGMDFDEDALMSAVAAVCSGKGAAANEGTPAAPVGGALSVGICGARANPYIREVLAERGVRLAFDLTCTGIVRSVTVRESTLVAYARALLEQFPCMRMEDTAARDSELARLSRSVDGVIYHTVQFCDMYAYEYAQQHKTFDRPLLLLDTDCTTQSLGQIRTRLEAFLESLAPEAAAAHEGGTASMDTLDKQECASCPDKADAGAGRISPDEVQADAANRASACAAVGRTPETTFVMGVDSGSTSTNAVILDGNRRLVAFAVVRTGAKAGESAQAVLDEVLEKARLTRDDIVRIVSTGYGRVSIPFADHNVTEISCHGKGAHYFNPAVRTILDIGGQDSKGIRLNEDGEVVDFAMNDKCAAGTGRFLEAVARTLEIRVDDLGPLALRSTKEVEITSMCTVFAESEIISLIANNTEQCDIAAGVCRSIAGKTTSLLKRVHPEPVYMMTGGVAKNPGVVAALEEKLGAQLYICPEPEIVGAVGAALYALSELA